MKKIIALFAAAMMITTAAHAEVTENKMYTGNRVINVSGVLDSEADTDSVTLVLKKGDEVGAVYETKANEDKSFRFTFKFDKNIDGYEVLVRSGKTALSYNIVQTDLLSEAVIADSEVDFIKKDTATMRISIDNRYLVDGYNYKMIVAGYDENGKLIDVSASESKTANNSGITTDRFEAGYTLESGVKSIKAFLFDDTKALIPLCSAKFKDVLRYKDKAPIEVHTGENGEKVCIALMGDSTTEGAGKATLRPGTSIERYPNEWDSEPGVYHAYDYYMSYESKDHNLDDVMDDSKLWNIERINAAKGGATLAATLPNNNFFGQYEKITKEPDILIVMGGINDDGQKNLGTADSTDNNTFYGALKTHMRKMIEEYPDTRIVFMTPIYRGEREGIGDYVTAIKEMAEVYGINVIDLYNADIRDKLKDELFDGTHPNAKGYQIIAKYVMQELQNGNIVKVVD